MCIIDPMHTIDSGVVSEVIHSIFTNGGIKKAHMPEWLILESTAKNLSHNQTKSFATEEGLPGFIPNCSAHSDHHKLLPGKSCFKEVRRVLSRQVVS